MGTLYCALENGSDLHVNERQKIGHYPLGLLKKEECVFLTSRGVYVNCDINNIAMLYTHSIGDQPWNTMVVFIVRDRVPSARYSSVCSVLRLWRISLIPT